LSDTLVRFSCGIEHPDDLLEDLHEGLEALKPRAEFAEVAEVR